MSDRHPTIRGTAAAPSRRRGRQGARGFTLVELMVSLTAGLLIAAAAFLLARNSSRFFQHEAGITAAQFGSVIGMSRLQADIRRAGYLGSPHAMADPNLCGDTGSWPVGLQDLAGISIIEEGSVVADSTALALSTLNGLNPDAVIIGGMFDSTEQFAVDVLSDGGTGTFVIQLQNDGAVARTQVAATQGAAGLDSVFAAGRFLRIVDQEGRIGFGTITGAALVSGKWQVSVAATPTLPTRSNNETCGCEGFCTGAIVSPVTRVRYDLRAIDPVANPGYAPLYQKADHDVASFHRADNEVARTELVRVELAADGSEVAGSLELLTEYAVDLKFGVTREIPQNPPADVPFLQQEPIGDPDVYTVAAPPLAGGTPEHIRSVQVRLTTRATRADRQVDINPTGNGGLLRFSLGINRGYARVRTLVSDIALVNQRRWTQ